MLLGGLALVLVALARREARLPVRALPGVAAYTVALTLVQLTYFEAIAAAGVAVAIFLQYTSPLIVAVWESARARRLPSRPVATSMSLAVAGSALLVLPGAGTHVPLRGFAWGIGSAFAFAAATVMAGALRRRGAPATTLLATGLALGSLAFLPVRTPWQALTAIAVSLLVPRRLSAIAGYLSPARAPHPGFHPLAGLGLYLVLQGMLLDHFICTYFWLFLGICDGVIVSKRAMREANPISVVERPGPAQIRV